MCCKKRGLHEINLLPNKLEMLGTKTPMGKAIHVTKQHYHEINRKPLSDIDSSKQFKRLSKR